MQMQQATQKRQKKNCPKITKNVTWAKKKSIFSRLWFIEGVLFHLFFQERENAKFPTATGQESAHSNKTRNQRRKKTN